MSEANLGKLIDETAQRDAIHVAIAPVVAAHDMNPGMHVGLDAKGLANHVAVHIGIVDPFLTSMVQKGQRFYMVLYPRSITSLRHEWTHPDFDGPRPPKPTKDESEAWLREFCKNADCPDYGTVLAAATGKSLPILNDDYYDCAYRNDGEYLTFYGRDAHSEIPPEFWDHVENVTGDKIPLEMRASSFSCSC